MTIQKVPPEQVQTNGKRILAAQINELRSLFTSKGLQEVAYTRDGIPYYASAETCFALAQTAPVEFSYYLITNLGGLWYDAVHNSDVRNTLEERLTAIAKEWIEKYCVSNAG